MTKFEVDGLYYSIINNSVRAARVGDDTKNDKNAIYDTSIVNINIPGRVLYQGTYCKVTEIGRYAMYQATNIKSIKISANIEIIRESGLRALRSCESIIFEKNSHLTVIENRGMYDLYSLSTLEFNGNCLKTIGFSALRFMIYNMKNLTIPSSVSYIDQYNIAGNPNMQDVYYCGDNRFSVSDVFVSDDNTYANPSSFKVHTKSTYHFNYFSDKEVTKDADQYCAQLPHFFCPINNNEHCSRARKSHLISSLFIVSLLICS